MKRRILFVDDEPNILQGLKRMLRPLSREWEMAFVQSGPAALQCLAESSFDVVVTDMRMPVMDGAQLLEEVKKLYPKMVRIVLSGHSDKEMIMRSVGSAHQYLAKPCSAEMLKDTIAQAFALRDLLESETLKQLVSRIETLPSLPNTYLELEEELRSPDASIQRIGRLISKDVAMTTKILHLVNSAFFGLPRHVSSPAQAASMLGLDTIGALFLSVHVFSQFQDSSLKGLDLSAVSRHSQQVGAYARMIAIEEGMEKRRVEDTLVAGMLHDVGKLILAANLSDGYAQVLALAPLRDISLWEAEKEIFGGTHAEVGAYLLGLWGFSDQVIKSVAFHHTPSLTLSKTFGPLAAVHVANAFAYESQVSAAQAKMPQIDSEYIEKLERTKRVTAWRERCESTVKGDEPDE